MRAVLVFDMPKDCYECPCVCDEFNSCQACNDCKRERDQKGIPSWCPLKPLPHSKQMENRWFSDDYSKGWNACLDEITGETE